MKYILVTGGAGFIGSNFIDYFLLKYDDYTIINIDKMSYAGSSVNMLRFFSHPRHVFIKGDIANAELVEKIFVDYGISGVIHFAAESHVDNSIHHPDVFIKSNIVGTFTLLETAKRFWKGDKKDNRFYHISTDEVYGSLGKEGVFTENSPYQPNSPYSASKASSDHLVRSYGKTYGLNTVMSHCSNNYGPYQHDEKLIPTIIRHALSEKPIPIYGSGNNIRDWLFVQDHCEAIDIIFHQALPGACYNIGGQHEMTNKNIALLICRYLDNYSDREKTSDIQQYEELITSVTDRAGHDFRYAVSIEKFQSELGWSPRYDFTTAISKTIQYYIDLYRPAVSKLMPVAFESS